MMTNIENLMSFSDDLKFDDLKDNEQTETTIDQPKYDFPDTDSESGGNPVEPDENDNDETTISIGS